MNVMSRKTVRERNRTLGGNLAEIFLKLSILTADDVWGGIDGKEIERFIDAYGEYVEGYGELGVAKIDEELAFRGIKVELKRGLKK